MYGKYFNDLPKLVIPVEDFNDIDESFGSPNEKVTEECWKYSPKIDQTMIKGPRSCAFV